MRKESVLLASCLVAACASIDSSPRDPRVTASDRQQAAEQHPQLLAQFGGAYPGPQAAYVSDIGERIAAAAGLSNRCTFTLVNSDVVNAFAVPGCYVYVTRGLLGIVNSEAELASVLGHEVGHVVADHSARRQNASTLSGLGSLAVGILTGSGDLAQVAGQAAQLYTLGYSRGQEHESDDLGIQYLLKAGYDPYAAADMLEALQNHDRLQARSSGQNKADAIPAWARTHPLTAERIARATRQARATGLAPGARREQEAPYLAAVDGLLYGDDPAQGYVNGRRFAHPTLRIAFDAPPGFTLTNSSEAVRIEGPSGARALFSGDVLPAGGLEAYATGVLREALGDAASAARVGATTRTTVNGLETVLLPANVAARSGTLDVTVAAYRVGDSAYHFTMASPPNPESARALDALVRSFRPLSQSEAAALRPRYFDVVTVRPGDSIASLASRMAVEDHQLDRFLVINARAPDQPVRPGEQVKLVIYGRS